MARKRNAKRPDGRYAVQVYLGRTEDGRRQYKTVYGQTQKEADEKALEIKIALKKRDRCNGGTGYICGLGTTLVRSQTAQCVAWAIYSLPELCGPSNRRYREYANFQDTVSGYPGGNILVGHV